MLSSCCLNCLELLVLRVTLVSAAGLFFPVLGVLVFLMSELGVLGVTVDRRIWVDELGVLCTMVDRRAFVGEPLVAFLMADLVSIWKVGADIGTEID